MSLTSLRAGFIPLIDCAPFAIAHEIGFAEEEGLALELSSAPSWSALRDQLALGHVDAAHMLAPVPVAVALGLGGMPARFDALSVMSINGNVIGVSKALGQRMAEAGHDFGFDNAEAAGRALLQAVQGRLRIGVPFPFSMHAELVYHWLGALGLPSPQGLDVRTVPPPQMAVALAKGEIDAFCVGEPWGSIAVEGGHGALLLPGSAIWAGAPEKVLAVRHDWAQEHQDLAKRLIRAIWRAQRWLGQAENLSTASEILARRAYLDMSADIIERALTGHLIVTPEGTRRAAPGFLRFYDGAAGFPWRSQALWIADRLAARTGLPRAQAAQAARAVFRSDLYREALTTTRADLPGASEKVEGANLAPRPVASQQGTLVLQPDAFFDGAIFDPASLK
ncbi:MAG: ABC transporter substrate-binding protein [Mangrovicoccus sp.]|nr:ABC transporter substrate-binding protein [Mangrovicoccus sp.]